MCLPSTSGQQRYRICLSHCRDGNTSWRHLRWYVLEMNLGRGKAVGFGAGELEAEACSHGAQSQTYLSVLSCGTRHSLEGMSWPDKGGVRRTADFTTASYLTHGSSRLTHNFILTCYLKAYVSHSNPVLEELYYIRYSG